MTPILSTLVGAAVVVPWAMRASEIAKDVRKTKQTTLALFFILNTDPRKSVAMNLSVDEG
jgi:hypothetical protein